MSCPLLLIGKLLKGGVPSCWLHTASWRLCQQEVVLLQAKPVGLIQNHSYRPLKLIQLHWKGLEIIHTIPSAGRAFWAGTSSIRATSKSWKAKKASNPQSQHLHSSTGLRSPNKTPTWGCFSLHSELIQSFAGPNVSLGITAPSWHLSLNSKWTHI